MNVIANKALASACSVTLAVSLVPVGAAWAEGEAAVGSDSQVAVQQEDELAKIEQGSNLGEPAPANASQDVAQPDAASAEQAQVADAFDDAEAQVESMPGVSDEFISDVMAQSAESASEAMGVLPVDARANSKSSIESLAGETQYDTAAAEALAAYPSGCSTAVVASGESYVDALSATGLAGALDCPILLTGRDSLPDAAADALSRLGVTRVVVVGGKAVVGAGAESALSAYGPVERLWGDDQFDTQLAVYSYGAARGLWGATAVVASGSDIAGRFADALSASPVAFALKAPVFLVDDEGNLPDKTKRVLVSTNDISQVLVAGGSTVVSNVTEGFMQAVTLAGGGARNVSRAAGETLYDTSFEVARWAVENGILNWDNVAFATSIAPYDALAGSVLQGKRGGVLLVAGQGDVSAATKAGQAGANAKQLTFMGGSAVIKPNERVAICDALGIVYLDLLHVAIGISLSGFANIEVAANAPYQGYSLSDIMGYMDPGNWAYDDSEYYQFAVLSDGYSGMSAEALDAFISRMCRASERSYGVVSNMRGTGAAFVEAAKTYNINEVYLVCHAALESAWGCSKLAQGGVSGYEGYLNFYGIGAYDIDPNNGGAALAKKNDWSSPDAAILGAAKWISQNYVHPTVSSSRVSGAQNTLWRMRWDVRRAIAEGTAWHQYATAGHWATSIAKLMSQFYDYHGIKTQDTGLRYEVPQFQ